MAEESSGLSAKLLKEFLEQAINAKFGPNKRADKPPEVEEGSNRQRVFLEYRNNRGDWMRFELPRNEKSINKVYNAAGWRIDGVFPKVESALQATTVYREHVSATRPLRIVSGDGRVLQEINGKKGGLMQCNYFSVERLSAGEWKEFREESEEVRKVQDECGYNLAHAFDEYDQAESALQTYYNLGYRRDTRIVSFVKNPATAKAKVRN